MPIAFFAPAAVTRRVPFVVTVEVHGLTPGVTVTVRIEQKSAAHQAQLLQSASVAARGGTVFKSFQVSLHQRGTAFLFATAEDERGAALISEDAVIEVV